MLCADVPFPDSLCVQLGPLTPATCDAATRVMGFALCSFQFCLTTPFMSVELQLETNLAPKTASV